MPTRAQHLTNLQNNPYARAWLDTLSWAEGAGYNTLFGGSTFSSYAVHPNVCIPYKTTCSTAAGKYQFLNKTWRGIASKLGLTDFSPINQDIAALELTSERGALNYILRGDIVPALKTMGCAWASLPYNGRQCNPPQKERPLQQVIDRFNANVARYSGGAVQPVNTLPANMPVANAIIKATTPGATMETPGRDVMVTMALVLLGTFVLTR